MWPTRSWSICGLAFSGKCAEFAESIDHNGCWLSKGMNFHVRGQVKRRSNRSGLCWRSLKLKILLVYYIDSLTYEWSSEDLTLFGNIFRRSMQRRLQQILPECAKLPMKDKKFHLADDNLRLSIRKGSRKGHMFINISAESYESLVCAYITQRRGFNEPASRGQTYKRIVGTSPVSTNFLQLVVLICPLSYYNHSVQCKRSFPHWRLCDHGQMTDHVKLVWTSTADNNVRKDVWDTGDADNNPNPTKLEAGKEIPINIASLVSLQFPWQVTMNFPKSVYDSLS
jgi:hypothetical protein